MVVIATAKKVDKSDDRPTHEDMKKNFVAEVTTLEVQSTIKGKLDGKTIKVLHFQLEPGVLIENGPCLVTFRTKGVQIKTEENAKIFVGVPEYLLFLKARKDGRYEPLSGQYDPALSIREMYHP